MIVGFVRRPVCIAIVTTLLFALIQVALVEHGSMGPACARWLTGPDPEAYPYSSWTSYGQPLEFLRITEEGCFTDRTRNREFWTGQLLVDIAIFGALGLTAGLALRWLDRSGAGAN
jgi:hypothetical protein